MEKPSKLRGIGDIKGNSWDILKFIQTTLNDVFSSHGYQYIETPILEATDLFLRKGGAEISTQLYSFKTLTGEEVSIRPEFTSSILRHSIDEKDLSSLPFRFQYAGPVLRFDMETGNNRQFHQAGIELIGSTDPLADSEILTLGYLGLSALGLERTRIVITDLGIYGQILQEIGLSEHGKLFVMSHLNILRNGDEGLESVKEKAQRFAQHRSDIHPSLNLDDLRLMSEAKARYSITEILKLYEIGSLGRRTTDQITERLLGKIWGSSDASKLDKALEIAGALAMIKGEPQKSLHQVKILLRENDLLSVSLDRIEQVLNLLRLENIDNRFVTLDFGLARGMSYYTGIVFELINEEGTYSLGGGGRYDDLAKSFGGEQKLPALGFAYDLDYVINSLQGGCKRHGFEEKQVGNTLILPTVFAAYSKALAIAKQLRANGNKVEMEVCGRSLEEAMAYAKSNGINTIVEVGKTGVKKEYAVG